LHYGERVEIVRQEGTAAQIRTRLGVLGWLLDTRQLMDRRSGTEQRAARSRSRHAGAGSGQTKTSAMYARAGPQRQAYFSIMRGTHVLVLDRTIADAPQSNEDSPAGEKGAGGEEQKPKQEDWLFVLRAGGLPLAIGAPAPDASSPATQPRFRGPCQWRPERHTIRFDTRKFVGASYRWLGLGALH